MSTDYAIPRGRSDDMLTKYGAACSLAYPGGGTYDPATGTTSGTAPDPQIVQAAFFPLTAARYAFQKLAGSNIVEGDQQCLVSALNASGTAITAPEVNGTITDANNDAWTIIQANPLSPAGAAVLYDLVVRKAQ